MYIGKKILIADDEPDIVLGLSDRLKWLGHEVTSTYDGQAALTVLESQRVDLVFLDLEELHSLPVRRPQPLHGEHAVQTFAGELERRQCHDSQVAADKCAQPPVDR